MKKLLILLFSILISFNSYGEWKMVSTNVDGNEYYVEIDTVKKHDGYVYFWYLDDYLQPSDYGIMSIQMYLQGDCGANRSKDLTMLFYKKSMGKGEYESYTPPDVWQYPRPGSSFRTVLDYVCDYFD
jgi:hypothetical protein